MLGELGQLCCFLCFLRSISIGAMANSGLAVGSTMRTQSKECFCMQPNCLAVEGEGGLQRCH